MNVASKENLKHLFGAIKSFQEGVKEKSRRSCNEVALNFFNNKRPKLNPLKNRKEG